MIITILLHPSFSPLLFQLVKKTFVIAGPKAPEAKAMSVVAAEITSFFTRSNYQIADRGEVVT